jgi:flagellar biosynthesis protein FlhB
MAEQEQNRSEEATPFKLEEARKKGSVAKSQELNSFAILVWMALAVFVLGAGIAHKTLSAAHQLMDSAASLSFDETHVARWLPGLFKDALFIVLPLMLGTVIIGVRSISCNVVQCLPSSL